MSVETSMRASRPRAVYYQHEDRDDLGTLGPILEETGFELVRRYRSVKSDDVEAELVISLGGSMSAREPEKSPYLLEEQRILSQRLALGRPCLGLCLGAHVLAASAGSSIIKGENGLEVGTHPAKWSEAGWQDDVTSAFSDHTAVAHWHEDTFTPVPGATLLASTSHYPQQAFRIGGSYGFQFHIEVPADTFAQSFDLKEDELVKAGRSPELLKSGIGRLRAAETTRRELLSRLAGHFMKRNS